MYSNLNVLCLNDNSSSLQKTPEVSSEMQKFKHAVHIYERFSGLKMSFFKLLWHSSVIGVAFKP